MWLANWFEDMISRQDRVLKVLLRGLWMVI